MHGALNQSGEWFKKIRFWCRADLPVSCSLRASSPVWASEASLARTREPASERASGPSIARSGEAHFVCPNRRACSQASFVWLGR